MPTSNPLNPKTASDWVLTVLVALAVFGGAAVAWQWLFDDSMSRSDMAKAVCQGFVEDRLRAPSTADFSSLSAVGRGEQWTVKGAVDSQNAFGVPIRSNFTCVVEHDGGVWRLVRVTGLQ